MQEESTLLSARLVQQRRRIFTINYVQEIEAGAKSSLRRADVHHLHGPESSLTYRRERRDKEKRKRKDKK